MVKNITIWSSLEPILYSKEFIHLADISRKLNSSHTTIRQYLNYFEKKNIIIKEIKGRLTMYKPNYANPLIIDYFTIVEKYRLIKKCKEDLLMKEIVTFLHEISKNNSVVLFGSFVNNSKKANDIDILVVGKVNFDKIKLFEKKFGINFHIINIKSMGEITISLKKEIIDKHLIIENSEGVIKWMLEN